MAQKYYNSAETAKLLGKNVDDIKAMLERRELHGYRDGADWKFKTEDIDRLAKQAPPIAAGLDEGAGDVLLSDVALGHSDPGLSGTVIGMSGAGPIITDSDIRLAESNIQLGEAAKTPIPTRKAPGDSKASKFEDLTLADDLTVEDSSVARDSRLAGGGSSTIDLGGKENESDDDLVLGGSSVGSDVTIGGDSGISLLDPSDSGLSLETPINLGTVSEASIAAPAGKTASRTDDEFLLTPLEESAEAPEGGSQVLALDTEAAEATVGAGSGISMASMLDEDLTAVPSLEMGMAEPLGGPAVLGGPVGTMAEGAALAPSAAAMFEPPYTAYQIAGLSACAVVLMLCGMMMYDLLRNMWSWQGPYPVNSGLMDTILGWFGI